MSIASEYQLEQPITLLERENEALRAAIKDYFAKCGEFDGAEERLRRLVSDEFARPKFPL